MNKKLTLAIFGVSAFLALTNSALAANKTRITDTLGAGNSSMALDYASATASLPGTYTYASGTKMAMDLKQTANRFGAGYYLGVTNTLDMGIFLPLSLTNQGTLDYTSGANKYNESWKDAGQGDITFGFRYLHLDKQKDGKSLNVILAITPSTAPSGSNTARVTRNGVVTTVGKDGESGNGYITTAMTANLSFPKIDAGEPFVSIAYSSYGSYTQDGTDKKRGNNTVLMGGTEMEINERVLITPYIRFTMSASGKNGTTTIGSSTDYDLGVKVTNDISKSLSVTVGAAYNSYRNVDIAYASGDKWSYSGNGYVLSLSTMFFF